LGFDFTFEKAAYILVNSRGEEIHLGDELEVKVKSGDLIERQIIFSLVD
jgi:exoribonuclease R